jgi:hypothetical protein
MTQREAGRVIGRSASWISLIEAGKAPRVPLAEVAVIAAAVGLKLYVKAFPAGRRPLDAPQLGLLERFNVRIHRTWRREVEKVMPIPGDLRAIDELITGNGCSCAVEAITRLASVEAQLRSARAKQRDIGATRLILLVSGTQANRSMLREIGPVLGEQLPVGTRAALRALAAGDDPGGDCLILL